MKRDRSYYQICQGHYTMLTCCHGEEPLCEGHGVVSYCDNTCASALDQWATALVNGWIAEEFQPTLSTETLALGFYNHDTGANFTVVFEGTGIEDRALAFMLDRRTTHTAHELAHAPFDGGIFPRVSDLLYPMCHHGMSADLCMDPYWDNHFGTREWEMAYYDR